MTEPLIVAEQSVLGAIMLSPRAIVDVQRILEPHEFYDPKHHLIYAAALRLQAGKNPTDVVAVVDELLRAEELLRAGGAEYLHMLTSVVPTASSAEYYAGIVKEAAVGRALTAAFVTGQDRIVRGEQPGSVLAHTMKDLTDLRDHATSKHRALRSLGEVLSVPWEEDAYDWTIPGILERRDRLMLTGSEGGGKSTLIRQLAISAAAGMHPFTQQPMDARRVLVIDAENTEKQWRRAVKTLAINAHQRGTADPRSNLAPEFMHKIDVTRAADLGEIHGWIDDWKPDIVVIGPLYRICRGTNNDEEAAPVLDALETIRDRDVTLIVEGHAGHGDQRSQHRDLRPIGSSMLLRWPEFGLGLAKPDKYGDPFQITRWRGDRDERHWPKLLTSQLFHPQTFPWQTLPGYTFAEQDSAQLI